MHQHHAERLQAGDKVEQEGNIFLLIVSASASVASLLA